MSRFREAMTEDNCHKHRFPSISRPPTLASVLKFSAVGRRMLLFRDSPLMCGPMPSDEETLPSSPMSKLISSNENGESPSVANRDATRQRTTFLSGQKPCNCSPNHTIGVDADCQPGTQHCIRVDEDSDVYATRLPRDLYLKLSNCKSRDVAEGLSAERCQCPQVST